jgi:hypothetical protein
MFFSFDEFNRQPEIINKKLSDTSNPPLLEDLLIEEGLIDELQSKNKKLINYLNKEKVKQMLDYIIKEPKEDDHNKGHKFPYICSKLFNVEEKDVMKYFFKTNKELLDEKEKQDEENNDNNNFKHNNNNIDTNLFFDLNQDEDNVNMEDNFDNFCDKEVNINEIQRKNNNTEDIVNNDEEINFDQNIKLNEIKDEDDIVNQVNENKEKKVDENNIKEGEDITGISNNEEYDNKDKDKDDRKICLIKSPVVLINNNSAKNKRYEIPCTKGPVKENKSGNKKQEEKNNKSQNSNNMQDIDMNCQEDEIEMLDYFLSFLSEDSELNYVLCGYFSSLMNNLLNINYISIINYLFKKRKNILKRFVYHSYRKSIAETLCKIIKFDDKFIEENIDIKNDVNDFNQLSQIRKEIIQNIFENIEINMDTEKLYSISFLINDLIGNKKIFELIVKDNNIIHLLIKKQLNDINLNSNKNEEITVRNQKNNFIIIIDIIINWLDNIKNNNMQIPMLFYEFNDMDNEDEDIVQQKDDNTNDIPELHHTNLSQALFDILPNLIKNNFNKVEEENDTDNTYFILQSYNDFKLKPLGLHKIKIVELLRHIMAYCKNIPNEYDDLLINSNFYENSFNYIIEYQWNNLYQESFFQFLESILTCNKDLPHEKSADYLFSKIDVLNFIITNLNKIKDNNKNSENENNTGNGNTAFLISLAYKINALIGGNYVNLNKSYTKEGSMTFKTKGENSNINGIDMFFNIDNETRNEKHEKDEEEVKPVNYLKKFCNEKWNEFFSNNIVNIIKIYEEKLCQSTNNKNDDDDLFVNSYDNNIKKEFFKTIKI